MGAGGGGAQAGAQEDPDPSPPQPALISVGVEQSLYTACRLLKRHEIHRLPAAEEDEAASVLCVITHMNILQFLTAQFRQSRRWG